MPEGQITRLVAFTNGTQDEMTAVRKMGGGYNIYYREDLSPCHLVYLCKGTYDSGKTLKC